MNDRHARAGDDPHPEEARAFSGDLLRAIVDSSPDWIFVKDLEHRFLLVNRAFAQSQALEPADMVGRLDSDLWGPELCEGEAAKGTRGFHHDDRDAFAGLLIRNPADVATLADGTPRVFDTFKGPLRDDAGRVYGVLAYSRDVTELRDAERSLRESERRFRVLFEQAAVGVGLLDTTTGRFLRVNGKYVEIIGYSEEEMLGLDFMRLTYPEDLAEDLRSMERLKRGEVRAFSLEKRLLRKDGTPIWVALTVSPMWGPGEPPSQHVAVLEDISGRKAAEQRSEQALAELDSTLAALPDLLFDVDDEGRIHDFRAPAPELLAAPPDALRGRTLQELLPADVLVIVRPAMEQAFSTGRSTGVRYRLTLPSGDHWFEISLARKAVTSGRPRLVAIARDVTERVLAEEERRRLEAQLRQAQKMEAIGTLAGGIAHDFNNLLTAIGLSAELARRALPAEHPGGAPLAAIDVAVRRAEKLVQQILTFGRTRQATRVPCSVNEAVREATNLLRATLPSGIELHTTLSDDVPVVLADPTQLQQVLINLGTNAWQAIERQLGAIRFETRRVTSPQGELAELRVEDDGAGMSPEVIERIFEPFFTTKGPGKGSGLGLSVVHGIVVEHGGTIEVESVSGRGTTFVVALPASPRACAPASPGYAPGGAPPAVDPPTRQLKPAVAPSREGARILFVDDEVMLHRPVLGLLKRLGYRATALARPREALELIRSDPRAVDVLVTDLSMPELSGIDLARAVTAIRPDLPIVLLSGFAPQPDEQLAEAGIRERLTKPFELSALEDVLRTLLRRA